MKIGVIIGCSLSDVSAFARAVPLINELASHDNEIVLYLPSGGFKNKSLSQNVEIREYGRLLYRNLEDYSKTEYYSAPRVGVNIIRSFSDLYQQLKNKRSELDVLYIFKIQANNSIAPLIIKLLSSHTQLPLIIDRDDIESAYAKRYPGEKKIPFYALIASPLISILEKKCIELADGITVASKGLERDTKKLGGINKRVCHVPNSIYPEEFCIKNCEIDELQKKTRIIGEHTIVFAGTLKARRATVTYFLPEVITYVMPKVVKEVPDAKLTVIGEGNYKKELMSLVSKYNLQENVVFSGWVSNIELHKSLALARVGIFPLKNTEINKVAEIPLKLAEYMAAGIGIVATDVGDIRETLKSCGIVVNPEDYTSFADAIIRLLIDKKLRKKLGKRARQKAEQEYNWKVVGMRLNKFLKDIINS